MEAVSSSVFAPRLRETCPDLNIPSSSSSSLSSVSLKLRKNRTDSLRVAETSGFLCLREVRCQASELQGGDSEDQSTFDNGSGLVSHEAHSLSHKVSGCIKSLLQIGIDGLSDIMKDLIKNQSGEMDAEGVIKPEKPLSVPHGSGTGGGTRAGLFRTPISGGVQTATSAHGLPPPALAVRNLMEQARFAHLCTVMSRMHHRRQGYPFGSLVDFAPDSTGHPIFSFSPLSIHSRNLLRDPRCSLVVQIPGWSGLSNARVTIFGDVFPLPEHQQEWAHKQYIAKHQQGPSMQWGNFYYFRMQNISDIYFIGGFGTVAWVDVKEYEALQPDKIALDGGEPILKELNALYSKPLKELLSIEMEVDDAAFISIDSKGTDIRVRQGTQFNIQRVSFEEGHSVETLEEAKAALSKLINKGQVRSLQK
ncbi:hypothetical protein K2173_017974 [Erythroxylum novogranatense]|uniref:CREG-like beta-barrel domain-containing protein n=1 Tax=Erythroxylum novogranatense TaxID=1862640 RepID=A0AAV8TWJ5_9ROSI|nr:hypothetical protein K2173_017974 [Erythroxylum novogranatense]